MQIIETDVMPDFGNDSWVYADIETNQLNPFLPTSKLWCIAVAQHEDLIYWHRIRKDYDYRPFFRKHPIIAHRSTFEGQWIRKHLKVTPRIYYDTKVGAYIRDEESETGLKTVAISELGVDNWAPEDLCFSDPDWDIMKPYNCFDVHYGIRLFKEVDLPYLKRFPKQAKLLKYITFPAIEAFIGAIYRGFHIDEDIARARLERCLEKKEEYNNLIDDAAGYHVNPNSPQQMCQLLYVELGLKCPIFTDKGNPSSGEPALIRLEGKHPVVDLILDWRKWQKYDSTYFRPWIKKGPILHANYGFTDTQTGRLNSTMVKSKRGEKNLGATLHQCSRDGFVRNIISPRYGDEWCLVAADVSQGELRLVAHVAKEKKMIEIFNAGKDIHLNTAMNILPGREIDKETRKKAKAVNFGFVYGMWAKKFKAYCKEKFGLEITLAEAEKYRETFFDLYDGLEPWHRRCEYQVSQFGWIDSVLGRRRHLPGAMYDSGLQDWIKREMIREAINAPIQGALSDLLLFIVGLIVSKTAKWKEKIDPNQAFLVGSAHDSALFECKKVYAPTLEETIKYTTKNMPIKEYFGFEFSVPIIMDTEVYPDHWELKEGMRIVA